MSRVMTKGDLQANLTPASSKAAIKSKVAVSSNPAPRKSSFLSEVLDKTCLSERDLAEDWPW